MKLQVLCAAMLLAAGSVGIAFAAPTNLITNGDFGTTSPLSTPTQFGSNSGHDGSPSCAWGGQIVTGWTGNGGYGIVYPSAGAASGTSACTQYGNGSTQRLPSAVTAPPVGPGTFIGLDGQPDISFGVSQALTGLTPGASYTVSFAWGSTQEMSRTGSTMETMQVALGNQALNIPVGVCVTTKAPASITDCSAPAPTGWEGQIAHTKVQSIDTHGWSGWIQQSFTFVANAADQTLSFLSIGSPGNLPPFAVLTGVSMTKNVPNVPEPPELALFGGGLLGLGLLTIAARRRALRRKDADAV